jgi:type 1 glutamine amidotransferase
MTKNRLLLTACLAVAAGFLPAGGAARAGDAPQKILFFSRCADYEDPMLRRINGQPCVAETVLGDLGKQNHIEFTFSKDGSVFTPENIARYDAFCFFTSGDLTRPGGDHNPPMTQAGKAALLKAIAGGKGFIGIYSAIDTFNAGGEELDPYLKMLGGALKIKVRGVEAAHQIVADAKFPGLGEVPADFAPMEQWYALKSYSTNLHVLLAQDTVTMPRGAYYAPNYPSTWAKMYGQGRVFYTSMGHQAEVWNSPVFQQILSGGLNWASGAVPADVTPNLDQATPGVNKQK